MQYKIRAVFYGRFAQVQKEAFGRDFHTYCSFVNFCSNGATASEFEIICLMPRMSNCMDQGRQIKFDLHVRFENKLHRTEALKEICHFYSSKRDHQYIMTGSKKKIKLEQKEREHYCAKTEKN